MRKIILLPVVMLVVLSCNQNEKEQKKDISALNAQEILDKSILYHDPNNSFGKTKIDIHIQEPRIQNPYRYSKIIMDNNENTFMLKRNRGNRVAEYYKDKDGELSVLLDGKIEQDTSLIRQFRLDTSFVNGYSNYYQIMLGLPMSMTSYAKTVNGGDITGFDGKYCYKIDIEIKESVISTQWHLYISTYDFSLVGVELINEEDNTKGERLVYEDLIKIEGINYPKIRHWRDRNSNDYLGSDILLYNEDILVE
ncbi:MAG: DUF6503 family protein [Bacteroidota bacterium]